MFLVPKNFGIAGSMGILALNCIVGGLIGGIIVLVRIKPVRNPEREKPKWEDTITNRMLHWSYTPEQKEEVKKALAAGVPKATILTYFYAEVTVEKMSSYRNKH